METKEIWKEIKGYEGLYEVSNLGNVRSLGNDKKRNTKILKTIVDKKGYLHVDLSKNGKRKMYNVHRLVAEAFIPNWFDDPQVNHIDEDKTNNNVNNLEWCDCKYNNNYGTHIEKISKPVLQLTKTGELVREWCSMNEAGRNGFNVGNISKCCSDNRRRKSHKGYIWKYKN